jgi:predicted nucleic acid-binding protein
MRVILDTNIIISAFLNPKGIPGEILSLVLTHKIIICYDNKIFSEYTDVLTRSKFNFDNDLVNNFLEFIRNNRLRKPLCGPAKHRIHPSVMRNSTNVGVYKIGDSRK